MNEHYCCDNIIPQMDNGIITCANCKTVLCDAPSRKALIASNTDSTVINELRQNLLTTPDIPTITSTHIDENDIIKIINEFKRQKYTKERIAFCPRTMVKIVINNVGLTKKYGHLVEDVRERLVKEKW